jgi:HEAT repeat protein
MNLWRFDLRSFLLGVLTSSFIFYLLYRFRGTLSSFWQSFQPTLQNLFLRTNLELQYRKDIIRFCQKEHLLGKAFALDQLLIPARVLSLLPNWNHEELPYEDITAQTVPLIYDDPLLASVYRKKSYTLPEMIAHGAPRLILVGGYGLGKTTALLETAQKIARIDHPHQNLYSFLPFYTHVHSLSLDKEKQPDFLNSMIDSARGIFSPAVRRSLAGIVQKAAREKRLILLLDGCDEITPQKVDQLSDALKGFLNQYPEVKIIIAASPHYLSDFVAMDFVPLSLCFWDKNETRKFIEKWAVAWQEANLASVQETNLWTAWVKQAPPTLTPLEWTLYLLLLYLKIPTPPHSFNLLENCIKALQLDPTSETEISVYTYQTIKSHLENVPQPSPPQSLQKLLSEELILQPSLQGNRFTNPMFLALFASLALQDKTEISLFLDSKWDLAIQAASLACLRSEKGLSLIETHERFSSRLTEIAPWLAYIPPSSAEKKAIIKRLANLILNNQEPQYQRARLTSALLRFSSEERHQLMKYLLQSKEAFLRQLGALGYGLLTGDTEIEPLLKLLEDSHPQCFQAACLALVNIATSPAQDAVLSALLHGHDQLCEAAAQALANDSIFGQAILKEAIHHENPRIRKACISGLLRVGNSWVKELLHQIAIEDKDWLVKDAAANAIAFLETPDPHIPQKRPQTASLAWLIRFAAQKGMGLAAGKSNYDILLLALEEGDPDTQLAALDYLRFYPLEFATPLIENLLSSPNPELRSAAHQTLWSFSVCRIPTP